MSGSAAFFYRILCPAGTYFCQTFGHYCQTLSDVRRLFPGLHVGLNCLGHMIARIDSLVTRACIVSLVTPLLALTRWSQVSLHCFIGHTFAWIVSLVTRWLELSHWSHDCSHWLVCWSIAVTFHWLLRWIFIKLIILNDFIALVDFVAPGNFIILDDFIACNFIALVEFITWMISLRWLISLLWMIYWTRSYYRVWIKKVDME